MIINLARRAHDHNWELDPITRSLLDTDFYKLLMLQFIWKHFPTTRASFTLINRSAAVPLGEIVNVDQLREQLDRCLGAKRPVIQVVAVLGTTYSQAGRISLPAVCAATGIGALACAILVANNLRDIPTARLSGKRTLLVVDKADANLLKSCRNLRNLSMMLAHQVNAYELLKSDALLVTADGLARMKEVFVK